ncbi:MAG TPA: nucleotide disphospho-sugar-binding domain-containing protein [Polyangiales bacterium]
MKRVLFVVEDITLAQVVRLVKLARSLPRDAYEVHFAAARFDPLVFADAGFVQHTIYTVPSEVAFGRLERGQRLYPKRVLARYVEEELALFSALKPDVVVGDLRFSLSVSAPHAGIPYAALINAYWSRALVRKSPFPLPEHPIVKLLGERLATEYFPRALPRVFAHFAAPVNALRKRYGLSDLGDLIDVLMFGDRTLFPDVPAVTPLSAERPSELFLGPVLWEPKLAPPPWWERELGPRAVYVTMGSSGRVDRLPMVLAGLHALELTSMVSTAGRPLVPDVLAAPYLPGSDAARRAAFVVCNGGSSTAYQALREGKPVLGIAHNLDQYLAMTAVCDAGAGILLRSDSLTEAKVTEAARALLEDEGYRFAAQHLSRELARYDSAQRFEEMLAGL